MSDRIVYALVIGAFMGFVSAGVGSIFSKTVHISNTVDRIEHACSPPRN